MKNLIRIIVSIAFVLRLLVLIGKMMASENLNVFMNSVSFLSQAMFTGLILGILLCFNK